MSSSPVIRILSDLHLAHPASLIKDVRQLGSLLEGARTVVFNGDTVELQMDRVREEADRSLEELKSLCSDRGIVPIFINGNHDPDISERNHVDLFDGRMVVTHGHALFPGIAPWGRDAFRLRENYRRALEERPKGQYPMEEQLAAATRACLRTPGSGKPPAAGIRWMGSMLSEMAHPTRPLEVFRAWMTLPNRAAAFAARYRPEAECVILGHTHLPGFWRRQGKCIMNTGAYFPWLGRRMIDVTDEYVSMRKVECSGSSFRPGAEIYRWSLRPVPFGIAQPQSG